MPDRKREIWLNIFLHLQFLLRIRSVVSCMYQFDSRFGKVGNFSSPRFPLDYPEDVECYYQFSGEMFETLRITFFVFDLEEPYTKGCLTDYVDISTITAYKVKLLVGRFCGSQLPPPIQTMHPSAEIIFKTNHIVQKKGFSGMYEFKDESMIPPPKVSTPGVSGCGGMETGTGGVITSPGYPLSFPKDVECLWVVRVHNSQHIYVRILELELHGSIANCAEAELSLFDGYFNLKYNPKLLKRYCGDLKYYKNVEEKTQIAPRNRLIVRFRTRVGRSTDPNAQGNILGFKLVWTAVNLLPKGSCKSFVCKNSHYCLNSNMCTETRHYCIDKSLVCNGLPNCSDEDFSDEDKCNIPLLIGLAAGGGSAFLILTMAVYFYRRHRRIRKSMSQAQALTVQLRQLEVSPTFANRPIGNFYAPPNVNISPTEINCSVHPHYDNIVNKRHGGYPTDV